MYTKSIDLVYFVGEYTSSQQSYNYPKNTGIVLFGTTDGVELYRQGVLRDKVNINFFDNLKILKIYGIDCDNSGAMCDRYIKDYPPEIIDWNKDGNLRPIGLINLTGDFYSCCYGGHSDLASRLITAFTDEESIYISNTEDFLIDLGWISIRGSLVGFSYDEIKTPTKFQIDTLNKLIILNQDHKDYVKEIYDFLNDVSQDQGVLKSPFRGSFNKEYNEE